MAPAITWIERHRKVWTDRFDQLEVHLRNIQSGAFPVPSTTPTTTPSTTPTAQAEHRPIDPQETLP